MEKHHAMRSKGRLCWEKVRRQSPEELRFQFAVNARRSPGRILGNHLKDQGANLFADTLPPTYSSES